MYCGFPKALNATFVAKKVLAERGGVDERERTRLGKVGGSWLRHGQGGGVPSADHGDRPAGVGDEPLVEVGGHVFSEAELDHLAACVVGGGVAGPPELTEIRHRATVPTPQS